MWSHPVSSFSLSEFFHRMGIHPIHAVGGSLLCCDLQSWEDCELDVLPGELTNAAARAITEAERTIERITGISPCPRFETERVRYPSEKCGNMKRRDGKYKSVDLTDNEFIQPGKRGEELIGTFDVCYFDNDSDGYFEIGQIEFPTVTVAGEIVPYFADSDCADKWRIRPVKCISDDTDNGTTTMEFYSWDLIEPGLLHNTRQGALFQRKQEKLDLCCSFDADGKPVALAQDENGTCPFVRQVELWRVWVDDSRCPVTLHHPGGADRCSCGTCEACKVEERKGCLQPTGICNCVRIVPTTETVEIVDDVEVVTCCEADKCKCTVENEPEYVTVCYLGGRLNDGGSIFDVYEPFKDAIYHLAMAWMEYSVCGCECELHPVIKAQKPIGDGVVIPATDQMNPHFSSVVRNGLTGEIKAWAKIKPHLDGRCER